MIHNIIGKKPLPVYGDGLNVRDWLHVKDHSQAIETVLKTGGLGEVYNIGGNNEWKNIDIVNLVCDLMDRSLERPQGQNRALVTFVKDRPGMTGVMPSMQPKSSAISGGSRHTLLKEE